MLMGYNLFKIKVILFALLFCSSILYPTTNADYSPPPEIYFSNIKSTSEQFRYLVDIVSHSSSNTHVIDFNSRELLNPTPMDLEIDIEQPIFEKQVYTSSLQPVDNDSFVNWSLKNQSQITLNVTLNIPISLDNNTLHNYIYSETLNRAFLLIRQTYSDSPNVSLYIFHYSLNESKITNMLHGENSILGEFASHSDILINESLSLVSTQLMEGSLYAFYNSSGIFLKGRTDAWSDVFIDSRYNHIIFANTNNISLVHIQTNDSILLSFNLNEYVNRYQNFLTFPSSFYVFIILIFLASIKLYKRK
jgi:hypothetical protein